MLVGQDKRELGALVFPDEEAMAAAGICGADDNSSTSSAADRSASCDVHALLFQEVCRYNSTRVDYHPEDHIAHIKVGLLVIALLLSFKCLYR